jgi:hypothetical protein
MTTTYDNEIFATMRRQFDCTAANYYDPGVMTIAITLEEANQHLHQSVAGINTTMMTMQPRIIDDDDDDDDDEFRDRDRAT